MARDARSISLASKLSSSKPQMAEHGYTELRTIGRGSYGEAVLVQNKEGQCFVMKTVEVGTDLEQQKDALNEVRVLSSLKHPYIVRYQESFINNGTLAIVMDYAEGGDLSKRIRENNRLRQFFDEPQILRWMTQTVLGLKHLHKRNIIHRDIKPQNLFLTKNDDLRIGDFGISKVLGNKKVVVEQTIGTPYYLSPEICTDRLYSFACDVWALGCIVFELTALKVPFEAQNINALIKKITSGKLPVVSQAYSSELRQLVKTLLCPDHTRRPSASDIAQGPLAQNEMRKMLGGFPEKCGSSVATTPSTSPPVSAPVSAQASPRPASAARPSPSPSPRPTSAARQQSQRSQSPRSMLRQSANNLLADWNGRQIPNLRPKVEQGPLFRPEEQGPLARPASAAFSRPGTAVRRSASTPEGSPTPYKSPFAFEEQGPLGRPGTAGRGREEQGPLSRPSTAAPSRPATAARCREDLGSRKPPWSRGEDLGGREEFAGREEVNCFRPGSAAGNRGRDAAVPGANWGRDTFSAGGNRGRDAGDNWGRDELCNRKPSVPRPPTAPQSRPRSAVPHATQRRSYAFGGC